MTGYRVAILWRGDQEVRCAATPYNNPYRRVFQELIALGINARPVIYADDIASEVRAELDRPAFGSGNRPAGRQFTPFERGPSLERCHSRDSQRA
jgi:hypothetical protein